MVGGHTVYLDTDQKSGRDPYGRLVAVAYVRFNSTHYLNVNKALLVQGVALEDDFTNNEFSPSTWTLYVRYADASTQVVTGPRGPPGIQGVQGYQGVHCPPGEPTPTTLLYFVLGVSLLSLIIAIARARVRGKRFLFSKGAIFTDLPTIRIVSSCAHRRGSRESILYQERTRGLGDSR
jgi:hypothetical protein